MSKHITFEGNEHEPYVSILIIVCVTLPPFQIIICLGCFKNIVFAMPRYKQCLSYIIKGIYVSRKVRTNYNLEWREDLI